MVLKYLKTLHPPEMRSPMDLTLKTAMLIALLSGQRFQTIQALDVTNMTLSDDKCVFYIHELLKTSKPGRQYGCLELRAYSEDPQLCVVTFIQEYVKRTNVLRKGSTQLLLSYFKPYQPVSTETIGRWLKTVLKNAGIDTKQFGAQSTRSASVSAAKVLNVPIKTILDTACWNNAQTFEKFYDKRICA